jgi:hypothetical protein
MENNFFSTAIIARRNTLPQSEAVIIFREFYSNHRLTDCLEMLEQQGFHHDVAVFLLGFLGREG